MSRVTLCLAECSNLRVMTFLDGSRTIVSTWRDHGGQLRVLVVLACTAGLQAEGWRLSLQDEVCVERERLARSVDRARSRKLAGLAFAILDRIATKPFVAEGARGAPTAIVTGTLFAVVLAFVTLASFQAYQSARTGSATEADAVLAMARTANLFPPAQRDQLRSDLSATAAPSLTKSGPR
jgi:hypothetical protein